MTEPDTNNPPRSLVRKLLIVASCLATCALIGSFTYAVNEPARTNSPKKLATSKARVTHQDDHLLHASQPPLNRSETSFRINDSAEPVEALEVATPQKKLQLIEFDDVPLADAMRLFSDQSGLNVVTSAEAGKSPVTVFLKNVTPIDALEAIVKANGLFYRTEANSGIVRIATLKEYEKDLSSFREEQTRVFTLLYPNPSEVAKVIKQVFGDRVQLNRADAESEDLSDLTQRFSRFDLVDGRSLGLGNNLSRSGSQPNGLLSGSANQGLGNLGIQSNGNNNGFANQQFQSRNRILDPSKELSADQLQQLENQRDSDGRLSADAQAELMQRRDATIYVSTIRRNNQVIVRTGDQRSMDQIAALVTQLDVPTPTVLLEVKVLRVTLANGFNSAFEYLGGSSQSASTFSDGSLAPAFPGASGVAQRLGNGLGVAGAVPGALTFQVVDKNFRVRMQLLESKSCVTALATPLILTANNEVSRIFVGDTLPFTIGFTPSQVLSSVGAVNGAVAATPVTELRDVGQSLLITPNINADRTVTLRVVEENSERIVGGSSIPVPATSGSGVTNVSVDTVRRRTISGTVVAQDGMAVALGGMIEEHAGDSRDQIPVLGNIPGIGFLFRRQASSQVRSELVVIVRPYVFNTPSESAATSELLLGELSTHPDAAKAASSIKRDMPYNVSRSDADCNERAKLFQFHLSSSHAP